MTQQEKIRPKASKQKLTAEELKRAIYVDYEGNIKLPPTLLGWYFDGKYKAAILEPLFETCENRYKAKGIYVEDHAQLVLELIQKAEDEGRLIVSWSEHDFVLMSKVISATDLERLKVVYRNAIRTARPWYRNKYGPLPEKASLDFFEDFLGFQVPERFGLGLVGNALRLIREQIKEGRGYADLTDTAKNGWTTVVRHNKLDLEGMAYVLKRATVDIQTKFEPPEFKIKSRDWWFKVLGMLNHNWALIERSKGQTVVVYFFHDRGYTKGYGGGYTRSQLENRAAVVDSLKFQSINLAMVALLRNGFHRLIENPGPWDGKPEGILYDARETEEGIYSKAGYWLGSRSYEK